MWPFRKKESKPETLPVDGPWSFSAGKRADHILLLRLNRGYQRLGKVVEYTHQIGIATPVLSPQPNGLPGGEENIVLGEVEDVIRRALEEEAESLFIAVITTNGMREFVFYTRSPEGARDRFSELIGQVRSHQLQLTIQPDENWDVYAALSAGKF